MATKHAGGFSQMPKMMTDEPSVILKLKKGGKVHKKEHHEEHGHHSMHHVAAKHHEGMHGHAEGGHAPKKPSMAERRRAMNPNQYAHGGKVHHKALGGAMPMGAAPMAAMGQAKLAQMAPAIRAARAMQVRKALTGMKKGGHAGMEKHIEKLEKELHHHESLSADKAHHHKHGGKVHHISGHPEGSHEHHKHMAKHHAKMHKEGGSAHHKKMAEHHKAMCEGGKYAKGGDVMGKKLDQFETKTTIENDEKPFVKTKVVDAEHHDKAHGTGSIKEKNAGGYKRGGKVHHKATGGDIPADTNKKMNPGRTVMGGTIEGNEHDFENTEMHQADVDRAHGTGGVRMNNAGGFKHGGKTKIHHKFGGGGVGNAVEGNEMKFAINNVDGTPKGKTNTKTGEVKEANGGGYKHGGHASKKAYATGGNVNDEGKAVKMPRHFVSRPVANSLQSGTFKKGGKVHHFDEGGRLATPQAVGDPAPVSSSKPTSSAGTRLATPQAVNDPAPVSRPSAQKASQGKKRGGRAC
jgi:hypothetical protein